METIDPAAVLETLGIGDATILGPVTGGADALLWQVEWQGSRYALRVLRADQHNPARREAAAMEAARAANIPVPEVAWAGIWQGRPAMLIGWCAGETALVALLRQPERADSIGETLGRTLAAIHAVPAPQLLRDAPLTDAPGDALLHRDFHPMNVLMENDRVTGVIDWTDARAGNPLSDVARTITLLTVSPGPPGVVHPPGDPFRLRLVEAFRRGYESQRGPLPPDPEMARFYRLAGEDMLRSQTPRANQPGGWLTGEMLEPLRAWVAAASARGTNVPR